MRPQILNGILIEYKNLRLQNVTSRLNYHMNVLIFLTGRTKKEKWRLFCNFSFAYVLRFTSECKRGEKRNSGLCH